MTIMDDIQRVLARHLPADKVQDVANELVSVLDVACDNDGTEQDAFEEWAKSEGYDMTQHPLHWLFLHERTSAARNGWRAGIRHSHRRLVKPLERVG